MSSDFLKWHFFLFPLICVNLSYASVDSNFPFFNFDQIKYDIFTKSDSINLAKASSSEHTLSDQMCFDEIIAIGNGLMNNEKWAIRSKSKV